MDGFCKWPKLEVVWRGSWPSMIICGLIVRKASMTTLPLTDWIGSKIEVLLLKVSYLKFCIFEIVETSQDSKIEPFEYTVKNSASELW